MTSDEGAPSLGGEDGRRRGREDQATPTAGVERAFTGVERDLPPGDVVVQHASRVARLCALIDGFFGRKDGGR